MSSRRRWSGVAWNSKLVIRALMHTLLPCPVAPAMSRCGIRVRSPTIDAPDFCGNAERCQRCLDHLDVALDLLAHALAARGDGIQQSDRRELPFDLRQVVLGLGDHSKRGRLLRLVRDGVTRAFIFFITR